jgi:hypothetical protein
LHTHPPDHRARQHKRHKALLAGHMIRALRH